MNFWAVRMRLQELEAERDAALLALNAERQALFDWVSEWQRTIDEVAKLRARPAVAIQGVECLDAGVDLRAALDSLENQLIRQALERTCWNKKQAAKLLGINRTTLVEMLKRKRIRQEAA